MQLSLALSSFLLLFATCRAMEPGWSRPSRPTTTTKAPTTTTPAFQPQGPIQEAIFDFLLPDGGSKGLDTVANGCMLVFCHVVKEVDKQPENGCRAGCIDFGNRFEDGINDDWSTAEIYTAVKDRVECEKLCSGLSFLTKADDNNRRCESLCNIKFHYPDWKAYQDELLVVLEKLNSSPRLPIV